jgi:sugar/nucleoside kinase (ribokinase family)
MANLPIRQRHRLRFTRFGLEGNGNMTRVDLMLKPATASPTCIGVGFVVADIVEGSVEQFVAAGGSCGNVMAILAWFGWNAAPVSRLGPDWAAKVVRKDLSEVGVNLANLTSEKSIQTPIVIQRFVKDKAGRQTHRFSLTCPECGNRLPRCRALTFGQADSVIAKSGTPKTFYFDRVSPAALKLAQWAKEQGALVVFEPSSIGDERQFRKAVDVCHLLKYSHDRLGHLRDLGEAHSPRIIVETLAEEGLRVRWRGHWSELAAFQAPWFRDGAGSGDWCTAGLIHRLGSKGAAVFDTLQKPALLAALRFGQALAAVNCGYEGGRGAMLALTRDKLAVALTKLATRKPDFDPVGTEPSGIESALPKKICSTCPTPKKDIAEAPPKKYSRRVAR